jgi:hypothetical protein
LKTGAGLWDHLAVCMSVYPPNLLSNDWASQSSWNMACVSWHLSPYPWCTSLIPPVSLCLYVYPSIVARQRVGKFVPAAKNTRNNRRIVGRVVFCTVGVVPKESVWVCLRIPSFSIRIAEAVIWTLPKPSDSKIWSWVPWDSEPRTTVLARASNRLVDWTGLCIPLFLLGNGSVNTFPR